MRKYILISLVVLLPAILKAQDDKKFGITFHGFVKSDIYFDTRQSVAVREGQFYLYPKDKLLDENGDDINAKSSFNIISIQTRLKGIITGPDVLGAKTSAVIEAAFFGHTNADINGFRLRHAWAKLAWPKTQLLVGQYWHPMFITECFPGTVSFNTGAPFQPFTRNPQIRLTQSLGNINISFAAITQRDFADSGPDGVSSQYLRNDVLPELNLTVKYHKKSENGNEFLIGIGGDYKSLVPRLESTITDTDGKIIERWKTDEKVQGFSGMAFLKIKIPSLTFKLEGVFGQLTYAYTMLGGYAVQKVTDQAKNFYDYQPLDAISFWTDIHTNGKTWQFGIFGGYIKNNGSADPIEGPFYARGYSKGSYIDYVYRVSPRIMYNVGKMRFALEIERTAASYGDSIDSKGLVIDSEDVCNLRFLLGVYYFF